MRSSGVPRKALIAAVLGCVALLAGAATATAARSRHPLRGSIPRWLPQAHKLSATPSREQVSFGVLLKMRNESAAVAQLKALSEPSSSSYGKWLSNKQFDASYAPTGAAVASVKAWLRLHGMKVTDTFRSGMYVEASGSAAQVEKTFGTTLNNYRYHGKTVRSNATALSLPAGTSAAVSGAIAGVIGIDEGATLKQPADTEPGPPTGARYGVQPCSKYYGQKLARKLPTAYGETQPYAVCGYVPQQYQSAYGESGLLASRRQRAWRHGGDHRRLRGADDLPGRPALQRRAWTAAVPTGAVQADHARSERV